MFLRFITEGSVQVLIPLLLCLLFLKDRTKENYLRIAYFLLIYIVYQLLLVLPRLVKTLDIIQSDWNWEGKIIAILFALVCYSLFRKHFSQHNFFRLPQDKASNKLTWIVSLSVIIGISTLFYFIASSEFDVETLAFQLTMPAIDEELIFRGVFMGLLLTALPERIGVLGNPAVWVTAILFGLMHALSVSKQMELSFDWIPFLHTGIGGWVFGWLAFKSKSIVKPIITHAGTNFLAALATMLAS